MDGGVGSGKDKERAALEDFVNDLIGPPTGQEKVPEEKPEVKKNEEDTKPTVVVKCVVAVCVDFILAA